MRSLFPFERHRFKNEDILRDLPDDVLDILLRDQEEIHFKKGQVIFREGIKPLGVYFIRSGKVKLTCNGYEGREYIFYISGEQELTGHHGLINEESNPHSATAIENSRLVFIPKRNFLLAMRNSKEFQQRLMRNLSHEYGVFVHFSKILAQYNVRERLALALLIVNEKFLSGGSLDAVINLSREELASMVGTAKESLVRVMKELKEEHIITTRGHGIVIRDFDALIKLSNYFE